MPENTIAAFKKALDFDIVALEMDVVITKDKHVLVSHEPFMNPIICLDRKGNKIRDGLDHNIYRMNLDRVRTYDCGLNPVPRFPEQQKIAAQKPLLSEVFEEIEDLLKTRENKDIIYTIEAKCNAGYDNIFHPVTEEFAKLVYDVIKEHNMVDRVIVQSFDFSFLTEMRLLNTNLKMAMLVENERTPEENFNDLGFTPAYYSPHYKLANKETREFCDEKGMGLIVWTVNTLEEMKEMIEIGVDEIITDHPNLIEEIIS